MEIVMSNSNDALDLVEWHEGKPQRNKYHIVRLVWEVPAIPNFSDRRYMALGDSPQDRARKITDSVLSFLRSIHRSEQNKKIGISLRLGRMSNDSDYLSLFIIIRIAQLTPISKEQIEATVERFESLLPNRKYYHPKLLSPIIDSNYHAEQVQCYTERSQFALSVRDWATKGIELCKTSELVPSNKAMVPDWAQEYYPEHWLMPPQLLNPKSNSMERLCATLLNQSGQCLIEISLLPTMPRNDERQIIQNDMQQAEEFSKVQYYAQAQEKIPADPGAKEALGVFQRLFKKMNEADPWFFYAIRIFADARCEIETIASLLLHEATANSKMTFVSLNQDEEIFKLSLDAVENIDIVPELTSQTLWQAKTPVNASYTRLHRMATLQELIGFWTLPTPLSPLPGFNLYAGQRTVNVRCRQQKEWNIPLGTDIEGKRVYVTSKHLARHMLVVGTPGSGKTTTLFHMLYHLRHQKIPWMVLEPAKTEYRALRQLGQDVLVFTLGDELVSPFRFNPFEVPDKVPVERHIARLIACFMGAFNMFDPLPMLLDKAIRETYKHKGWSTYDLGGQGIVSPTISDLVKQAENVLEGAGYVGESVANIRASFLNRLQSLQRGSIGRMMDTRHSIPLDLLMENNVVLELDALNADEKALMMMFIFTHVYEYAQAQRRSNTGLKHVLVLEEAHNLIGHSMTGSNERANPKVHAVELFTNMLAEMRALGEGIIIADQLPSALAPQAMKNTNIKILHQLAAGDDREAIGLTMGMRRDDPEFDDPITFTPGEAFIMAPGETKAKRIQIELDQQTEIIKELQPPDDETLRHGQPDKNGFYGMLEFLKDPNNQHIFLPYDECPIYCSYCTPKVREWAENMVNPQNLTKLAMTSDKYIEYQQISNKNVAAKVSASTIDKTFQSGKEFLHILNNQETTISALNRFCAYVHFINSAYGLKDDDNHNDNFREILGG
jgi:hypothetical protein